MIDRQQDKGAKTVYRNPNRHDFWFLPVAFVLFLFLYSLISHWLPARDQDRQPAVSLDTSIDPDRSTPARQPELSTSGSIAEFYVVIGLGGFQPVSMKGPATSTPLNIPLTKKPYKSIRKEPVYTGKQQWYGHMDLGNFDGRRFHFVLDQQADETLLLYFDANKNNDLSDDGKPRVNEGSGSGKPGGFACNITILWQQLIVNSPFEGDFSIWFFSNQGGAKENRISHYSRTQLQGSVQIDETEYMALLIDQGNNDADLSNDGIALDLNRNGKIDRDERAGKLHTIGSEQVRFNISW